MKPYPLIFEPILREKVWGGRTLADLGKSLPDDAAIGESWEIADLESTSPDGAGGDAARSVVANGEMRGMTLHDVIRAMGENLMGACRLSPQGGFPLLVKFLDARENLSVQVHPNPAYAAANAGAFLKTESWYVLRATPGAVIYKGVRAGVDAATFRRHIEEDTVIDDLIAVPVRAGDFHHLPSGTCHALGAGVVVAEVQIPSDTTFRVYDWGREGRALHIDEALRCIEYGPPAQRDPIRSDGSPRFELVRTPHYTLSELRANAEEEGNVTMDAAPVVWMILEGAGRLECNDNSDASVPFKAGQTLLLPAALPPSTCYVTRDLRILEARLPE